MKHYNVLICILVLVFVFLTLEQLLTYRISRLDWECTASLRINGDTLPNVEKCTQYSMRTDDDSNAKLSEKLKSMELK